MSSRFLLQRSFAVAALALASIGAAFANSVSVNGTVTQQPGSSSCLYTGISESAAGNWTVTCGAGTKSITINPALCGSVCTTFSSISESAAGNWTVNGCVSAVTNGGVRLTQPAAPVPNEPIGSSLLLVASAVPCGGTVTKVEFLSNGALIPGASITAPPYQFNWPATTGGSFNLAARMTDSLGGVTTSASVNVFVNQPPVITAFSVSLQGSPLAPPGPWGAPATFTITASASDPDGSISRVEIWNGATQISALGRSTVIAAWAPVPAGSYSLVARAYDNLGSFTNSSPIAITVNPNQPPVVTLTSPASGASQFAPIALSATASDIDGVVTKVEYLEGGNVVASSTTGPSYAASWAPIPGSHTIVARATDNSGGQGTSAPATITVQNHPPTVQMIAPTPPVSAPVTLQATASDVDTGIQSVSFIDDATGALIGTSTSTTSPYTFTWTPPVLGPYTVHARAVDTTGGIADSDPVSFTVLTDFHMTLQMSPRPGASQANLYVGGGSMDVVVNLMAGMPAFSQMNLFMDGSPTAFTPLVFNASLAAWTTPLDPSTNAPIGVSVPVGTHTFVATATAAAPDPSIGESNVATVVVDAAPPPAAPLSCPAPVSSDPQVPGTIAGAASVADMGGAGYSIPIQVPPGIAGLAPSLSFAYGSQGGDGPMGTGWGVQGLSVIHRCPHTYFMDGTKRPVEYDSGDALCLDGQRLVPVIGGDRNQRVEYRTEHESYSKIESFNPLDPNTAWAGPAYFKVTMKSGQVMYYGLKTQEADPVSAPQDAVLRTFPFGLPGKETGRVWALYRVEDVSGNNLLINYTTDNINGTGTMRPASITYTRHGTSGGANQVVFNYEQRDPSDIVTLYDSGGQRTVDDQRLHSVVTFADGAAVKRYTLAYTSSASGTTGRTQLASVQECSGDGLACLNPTQFSWTSAIAGARTFNYQNWVGTPNAGRRDSTLAVDIDGDGKTDLVSPADAVSQWNVCTAAGSAQPCTQWASGARAQGLGRDDVWHFADFDGDGKADLVYLSPDLTGVTLQLSTGSGFGPAISAPVSWNGFGNPTGFVHTVGDFDGDGRAELALYNGNGTWLFCSYDKQSNHFGCSQAAVPVYSGNNAPNGAFDYVVADFNGDGKADFGYHVNNQNQWVICQSTSQAIGSFSFDCAKDLTPITTTATFADAFTVHVADFNGDGLADLAGPEFDANNPDRWNVCLSRGDRTFDCSYWHGPTATHDNSLLGDFNGDGRTDVAWYDATVAGWRVCESTGSSFNCHGLTPYAGGAPVAPGDGLKTVRAGDFNGDGKTDIATLVSDASGQWSVGMSGPVKQPADALLQVVNGLNAFSIFTYGALTDGGVYVKGTSAAYPEIDIASPMYVVKHLDTSTMSSPALFGVDYRYQGLRGQAQGAGLSGFAGRTAVDPAAKTCTETDTTTDFNTRKVGVVSSVTKRYNGVAGTGTCSGGTVLSQVTNTWESRHANTWHGLADAWAESGNAQVWEVFLTGSTEAKNDLDGTPMPSSSMSTPLSLIDVFGNPKQVTTSASDGYSRTTTSSYRNVPSEFPSTGPWFAGRVLRATVDVGLPSTQLSSNPTERVSSFDYDTLGRLTQETIEPDRVGTSQYLQTTYVYDDFGNRQVTTTTDGTTSRVTTTRYCAAGTASDTCPIDGRFPTYVKNAVGHVETRTYDSRWGTASSATGPNGLTTLSSYDKLGRKFCEQRPDGSSTGFTWTNEGGGYFAATSDSTGAYSEQHFDGLNREVVVKTRAFDGSLSAVTSTFDGRGRKTSVTKPYAGTPGTTNYTPDDLNRVITESGPGGYLANYVYSGLVTSSTVTGFSGLQTTTRTSNSRGEVVDVADPHSNHLLLQYDAFGNLEQKTETVGPDGGSPTTTTISFNARGQKTGMSDPDQGHWTYGYDSWGELTSQTDAKGVVSTFQYDALGRKIHSVEGATISDWFYDTVGGATCGIRSTGRLCKVAGRTVTQEYQYDELARAMSVKQTNTDGRKFQRFTTYDGMSRVREIVYPYTGLTLLHTYNPFGYLAQITEPAIGRTHWSAVSRFPDGRIHQQNVGALVTTTEYDALGRPSSISTPSTQSATYSYDPLGNLLTRADIFPTVSESFQYDSLNRLIAVNGPSPQTFFYDGLGNITSRTGVAGGMTYYPGTHQLEHVDSIEYIYDKNGNYTPGPLDGRAFTYTPFNKVETAFLVTDSSGDLDGYKFDYDADHQRATEWHMQPPPPWPAQPGNGQLIAVSSKDYFSDGITPFFEETSDSSAENIIWNHYVNTPEGVVQVIQIHNDSAHTRADLSLIRDQLGSTVIVGGDANEKLSYDAWGLRRQTNGLPASTQLSSQFTDRGFTGHEMMDVVGLINMNGRIYHPGLGRFLQPDPIVQAPQNLQSYNRYSYVLNNPLSLTDPTGYSWWTNNGRPAFKAIVSIVVAYFTGYYDFGSWGYGILGTQQIGVANAVAGGFAAGGIQGGNLQSAVQGAFAAALTYEMVDVSGFGHDAVSPSTNPGAFAGKVAIHAVAGCATSSVAGGSCGQGALSGAIGEASASMFADGGKAEQFTAAVVGGGLAARASGGSFLNGAFTAAFAYLFNDNAEMRTVDRAHYDALFGSGAGNWIDDPNFHAYVLHDTVGCSVVIAACDVQGYYQDLKRLATPFAGSGSVRFAGPGFVTTDYRDSEMLIVNRTIPGLHMLDPGAVARWISQAPSGQVSVNSLGVGVGPMRGINLTLAPTVWGYPDARIRFGRWP